MRGLAGLALALVLASVAAGAAPAPLPPAGDVATRGLYRAAITTPEVTFRLRHTWVVQVSSRRLFILLRERVTQALTFFNVGRLSGVIDPRAQVDPRVPPGFMVVSTPRDLVAWLRRHPRLKVGKPRRVRIGGLRGIRLDAAVRRGYRFSSCPTTCVGLFPAATPSERGIWFQVKGSTTRYYFVRKGPKRLLMVIEAPQARFRTFARLATGVVRSVRLR
jgi:hypothetical protein